MLPSNLVPIKDVNDEQVQRVGRIAVQMNNERRGHHFVYKRVVNGLFDPSLREPKFHIIVIEVINDMVFLGPMLPKWISMCLPFPTTFSIPLRMSSRISTSIKLPLSLYTKLFLYMRALSSLNYKNDRPQ